MMVTILMVMVVVQIVWLSKVGIVILMGIGSLFVRLMGLLGLVWIRYLNMGGRIRLSWG